MGTELPMPTGSEFSQAIFLDNDSTQIHLVQTTHPYIESISIPESPDIKSQPLTAILSHLESISGHDFTNNLYIERAFRIRASRPQHIYDPLSGIQEHHVNHVDEWIRRTSRRLERRALLMDWDRTLSLFEGYFGDDEGALPANRAAYYEDLLLVLLGGAPRLTMIRGLIARAHAAGIDLFVITNNGGCNDPGSGFNNFVTHLFGNIPYTMICGRDYGGHKGRALEHDPRFNPLANPLPPFRGGGSHGFRYNTRRRRIARRRNTIRTRVRCRIHRK
jgi:hypothetical protein